MLLRQAEVCDVIDEDIITHKKVMKLSDLLQVYVSALENTNYPNAKYTGENLKAKLTKNDVYKDKLAFCPLDHKGKFPSYLVYCSDIDVESAIKCAFEEVACLLGRSS